MGLSALLYSDTSSEMAFIARGVFNESRRASWTLDCDFWRKSARAPPVPGEKSADAIDPCVFRKKLSYLSSQALPALVRSSVISTPSRQPPRRNTILRLRAVHVPLLRASWIVVRFFSDFDIFDPEIDKYPMCKK